jgi:molybdate transport system ATP-binding protein
MTGARPGVDQHPWDDIGPDRRLSAEFSVERVDGFTLDLALDIEAGSTVALLGPNGAGKSTTIQALAGLLAIVDGRISLAGRTLDEPATSTFVPPQERNVGIVFQDYLLFDHLSVLDNVAFGLRARGLSRRAARVRAANRLRTIGIDDLADRLPRQLSGGQAQRVALARAIATDPDLLLLDEPLAALDVSIRTELRRSLTEHLETFAGPRLIITHEPTDAFVLADHIYIVENGRLTQHGTPDEVRRRPSTPYVAALTGTNLLTGHSVGGVITLGDTGFELTTATRSDGPVQAVVHPQAISLHRHRPQGSPRNTWSSTIEWIEPIGEVTRIRLAGPLPVMADITPAAAAALELRPGSSVWAAVKATEVSVTPG